MKHRNQLKKIVILAIVATFSFNTFGMYATASSGKYHFDDNLEYETYNLEDFGFEKVTKLGEYYENTTIMKELNAGSLHGMEIEGVYNFSVGMEENYLFFGGERYGLWVIPAAADRLRFAHINDKGIHTHPIDCNKHWYITNGELYNAGLRDVYLTNTDIKMKLAFQFSEPDKEISDLKVTVTINDEYTDSFIMEGITVSSMNRVVYASAKSPMIIKTTFDETDIENETLQERDETQPSLNWNQLGLYMMFAAGVIVIILVIFLLIMSKRDKNKAER